MQTSRTPRIWLAVICTFACFQNRDLRAVTPVVSSFSPNQGPGGTIINVTGSGFTGTTNVYFEPTGNPTSASFAVISDTLLRITVPPYDINTPTDQSFLVQAGTNGATLALSSDATQVTNGVVFSGGVNYFVVHSTGAINGSSGATLAYVQTGGLYFDAGSGTRTVVVEAGGIFHGGPGGTTRVFAEPGATVTLGVGGSQTLVQLNDVSLSVVPYFYTYTAAPEPATWILAATGAALIVIAGYRARRGQLRPV
jgi:hypothetical protein